jgi:hypothetical protein
MHIIRNHSCTLYFLSLKKLFYYIKIFINIIYTYSTRMSRGAKNELFLTWTFPTRPCVPDEPVVCCVCFPLPFAVMHATPSLYTRPPAPRRHLPDGRLAGPQHHRVGAPGQPQRPPTPPLQEHGVLGAHCRGLSLPPLVYIPALPRLAHRLSRIHKAPSHRRRCTTVPCPWRPELAISIRRAPNFGRCRHPRHQ